MCAPTRQDCRSGLASAAGVGAGRTDAGDAAATAGHHDRLTAFDRVEQSSEMGLGFGNGYFTHIASPIGRLIWSSYALAGSPSTAPPVLTSTATRPRGPNFVAPVWRRGGKSAKQRGCWDGGVSRH